MNTHIRPSSLKSFNPNIPNFDSIDRALGGSSILLGPAPITSSLPLEEQER
jgi:hypothetical protein